MSCCARQPRPAFTLIELLVVMALIGVLSLLTLLGVRAVSRDARLAAAVNTVSAALDNARALAMKRNDPVLVVFRPRLDGDRRVAVELVTCRWTGESFVNSAGGPRRDVIDRYLPLPDAPVRRLAAGIKVAAPAYAGDADFTWLTQSQLPLTAAGAEAPGALLGVLFGPDGSTMAGNPRTDATLTWVDFFPGEPPLIRRGGADVDPRTAPHEFGQHAADDEPFVSLAPFVAVYDDEAARQQKAGDWSDPAAYFQELTGPDGFITRRADRIHFNRYTGVAMR